MEESQQSPDQIRRVVCNLLIVSPFLFVGSYVFARMQGAMWEHALLIAVVALGMCLGAALLYRLRGANSTDDLE